MILGSIIGLVKRSTRSLDYSSCGLYVSGFLTYSSNFGHRQHWKKFVKLI